MEEEESLGLIYRTIKPVQILQKSTSLFRAESLVSPCVLPPLYPPPDWSTNHCGNSPQNRRPRITIQGDIAIIGPPGFFFPLEPLLNLADLIWAVHEYENRK